jgi:hypothetical protein
MTLESTKRRQFFNGMNWTAIYISGERTSNKKRKIQRDPVCKDCNRGVFGGMFKARTVIGS